VTSDSLLDNPANLPIEVVLHGTTHPGQLRTGGGQAFVYVYLDTGSPASEVFDDDKHVVDESTLAQILSGVDTPLRMRVKPGYTPPAPFSVLTDATAIPTLDPDRYGRRPIGSFRLPADATVRLKGMA